MRKYVRKLISELPDVLSKGSRDWLGDWCAAHFAGIQEIQGQAASSVRIGLGEGNSSHATWRNHHRDLAQEHGFG